MTLKPAMLAQMLDNHGESLSQLQPDLHVDLVVSKLLPLLKDMASQTRRISQTLLSEAFAETKYTGQQRLLWSKALQSAWTHLMSKKKKMKTGNGLTSAERAIIELWKDEPATGHPLADTPHPTPPTNPRILLDLRDPFCGSFKLNFFFAM